MHGDRRGAYKQRAAREWAEVVHPWEQTIPLPVPVGRAWWWPWLTGAALLVGVVALGWALWVTIVMIPAFLACN